MQMEKIDEDERDEDDDVASLDDELDKNQHAGNHSDHEDQSKNALENDLCLTSKSKTQTGKQIGGRQKRLLEDVLAEVHEELNHVRQASLINKSQKPADNQMPQSEMSQEFDGKYSQMLSDLQKELDDISQRPDQYAQEASLSDQRLNQDSTLPESNSNNQTGVQQQHQLQQRNGMQFEINMQEIKATNSSNQLWSEQNDEDSCESNPFAAAGDRMTCSEVAGLSPDKKFSSSAASDQNKSSPFPLGQKQTSSNGSSLGMSPLLANFNLKASGEKGSTLFVNPRVSLIDRPQKRFNNDDGSVGPMIIDEGDEDLDLAFPEKKESSLNNPVIHENEALVNLQNPDQSQLNIQRRKSVFIDTITDLQTERGQNNNKSSQLPKLIFQIDQIQTPEQKQIQNDWKNILAEIQTEEFKKEVDVETAESKSKREKALQSKNRSRQVMDQNGKFGYSKLITAPLAYQNLFQDSPDSLQSDKKADENVEQYTTKTLLQIFLVESSLNRRKNLHSFLIQDRQLNKCRTCLKKKLATSPESFDVNLKLAKVYFYLNKLSQAVNMINKANNVKVIDPNASEKDLQEVFLWKGIIFYYFTCSLSKFKDSPTMSKSKQEETLKILLPIIKQCEETLLKVKTQDFILAKYTLLKLALLLKNEQFGCGLNYQAGVRPEELVEQIRQKDQYLGTIAKCELLNEEVATRTLRDLINQAEYKSRPEGYLRLCSLQLEQGRKLISKQQQSQSKDVLNDPGHENHQQALDLVDRMQLYCSEITSTPDQEILVTVLFCKCLFKTRQYIRCFELLQNQYLQSQSYASLLFQYGKYTVKAMEKENKRFAELIKQQATSIQASSSEDLQNQTYAAQIYADKNFSGHEGYVGNGIGALEECKRQCLYERHTQVELLIGTAYRIIRKPLKTVTHWKNALEMHKEDRTLRFKQFVEVEKFLTEYEFFTRLQSQALIEVEKVTKLGKKPSVQDMNVVKSVLSSLKHMERLDRPNCQLFMAKVKSYVLEDASVSELIRDNLLGQDFVDLLDQFPSFIDCYVQYWKYLKFRLTEYVKQSKGTLTLRDVKDRYGNLLITKMKQIADQALFYSDCIDVPTSLWVESRFIFAKQAMLEQDPDGAVEILRDIGLITPSIDEVEGLSYEQVYENSKATGGNQAEGEEPKKQFIKTADDKQKDKLDQLQNYMDQQIKKRESDFKLLISAMDNLDQSQEPDSATSFASGVQSEMILTPRGIRKNSALLHTPHVKRNQSILGSATPKIGFDNFNNQNQPGGFAIKLMDAGSPALYSPFEGLRSCKNAGAVVPPRMFSQNGQCNQIFGKDRFAKLSDVLEQAQNLSEFNINFQMQMAQSAQDDDEVKDKMAVLESENFAVYSNFDFLYFIGKYTARQACNVHSDMPVDVSLCREGLLALNDYLLLLEHNFKNQNLVLSITDFESQRALALYEIANLLKCLKETNSAGEFYKDAIQSFSKDTYKNRFAKQVAACKKELKNINGL